MSSSLARTTITWCCMQKVQQKHFPLFSSTATETALKRMKAAPSKTSAEYATITTDADEHAEKRARVIVISGPTAVGKSSIAVKLAQKLDGEIISADSVQVYKGLDVGSAKTPLADRKGVPHHLIDIMDPLEEYSVGDYFLQAREATEQVLKRGKVPILVGGTGLYLRWYLYGLAETPRSTPELKTLVEKELLKAGGDWDKAVQILLEAGDRTATSLARNDWYRLHRSLEIIKAQGYPRTNSGCLYYSGVVRKSTSVDSNDDGDCNEPKPQPALAGDLDYDFICLFLYNSRETLYRFIDERCEEMLTGNFGLLKESSWLLDLGLTPNTTSASRAIGYRQAMEYLVKCRKEVKAISYEEFISFLSGFQKASRNYAKRQLTWFRQEPLYSWIDASRLPDDIVSFISNVYMDPAVLTSQSKFLIPKEATVDKKNELRCYEAQLKHFMTPSDCSAVIEWIRQTQTGRGQ